MKNKSLSFLRPPVFTDEEKTQLGRYLHWMQLAMILGGTIISLTDLANNHPETLIVVGPAILSLLAAFHFTHRGWMKSASYITVAVMIITVTIILSIGNGVHDIGITLYPVTLIVASFVLSRRGLIMSAGLVALSIFFVTFGEINAYLPIYSSPGTRPADALILLVIILLATATVNYASSTLVDSINKAKKSALELEAANIQLGQQTGLLRNSEARWRSLFDHAPDVIMNVTRDGMITLINHADLGFDEIYGGHSIYEFLPEENHREVEQALARVCDTGEAAIFESLTRNMRGEMRWFSYRIGPVKQAGLGITSLTVFSTEIHDRIMAEQAIMENKKALQLQADRLNALNEIGRAVSTLSDLETTLQTIFKQVANLIALDVFFIALYDEPNNLVSFPLFYDSGTFWKEAPGPLSKDTGTAKTIREKRALIIKRDPAEIVIEEAHLPGLDNLLGDKTKVSRTTMFAPLMSNNQVIGVVSAQSYTFDAFGQEQLDLLVGISNQITIAIQNARLYEAVHARADQLATLNEIGRATATVQGLDQLLNTALEQIKLALPLDAFYVALYQRDRNTVSFPIMFDSGHLWDESETPLTSASWITNIITTGEPMLLNRTPEDMKLSQGPDMVGEKSRASASVILAPMRVRDEIIGVISVQSYKLNAYDRSHLLLLTGAANQIAIAIQNARLFDELQTLNEGLEARVQQRTLELEKTNRELEAFSYSVSHDLRAPLRGVASFSKILLNDFADTLPIEARSYLLRIYEGGKQMGILIDDLLAFSRLSRQTLTKKPVNMTALFQDTFNELCRDENPDRIHFTLTELPAASADISLLKQVVVNLLSNAIKFSSQRVRAEITVAAKNANGQIVYSVHDNGAGFNMAHASKLFGVFQRLHRQDEFTGTGVGLAIVQRIIERHGGKVWAEAEPDQGATFYFTLGG